MKNFKYVISGLLSALLLPASIQCFAQAATLSDCQGIEDRLARYACYDKWDSASGTVRQSVPATRATTTRAPEAEQAPQAATERATTAAPTTAENFGRRQSNARVIDGDEGTELIDTIAVLEERGPSLWRVTLSSGQEWIQMISKRYPLNVGDEVRIYPTRWGSSYRLASQKAGGYIQVARVDNGGSVVATDASQSAPAARVVEAPRAQEDDEPSLLGRMSSRIGGIFSRDSDEEGAQGEDQSAPQLARESAAGSTVEGFGRSESGAGSSGDARVVNGEEGSELFDTIAALEERGPSLWRITLGSGQQWLQMISKRYPLSVGDEVRIYPTRWGSSYRLSAEKLGGYIQVQRLD